MDTKGNRCCALFMLFIISAVVWSYSGEFTDDHSDDTLSNWSVYGDRGWSESEGKATPAANTGEPGFLINQYNCSDNGVLEVEITADQWNGYKGGVVFRWRDTSNFYYAAVRPGGDWDSYIKFCKNTTDPEQGSVVASNISMDTRFTLRIELRDERFRFYIDGEYMGEVSDSDIGSGRVGYGYSSEWNDYIDYEGITWSDSGSVPQSIMLSDSCVMEDEPEGTVVGVLSVSEWDPENTWSYSLVSGEGDGDNESFRIDRSLLKTDQVFDYAPDRSYAILVRGVNQQDPDEVLERSLTLSVQESEDFSNWSHSSSIYFNTTESGADIDEDVHGFPVLIRLSSENFDFSEAQGDGSDLRFSGSDGSVLRYEIEVWDSLSQRAAVWVNVPVIHGNSVSDHITMYWGNPGVSSVENPPEVFDIDEGYSGVWHLTGNSDAAGGDDFINSGSVGISGVTGDAREFFSGDYLDMSRASDRVRTDIGSFSCWIRMDDSITGNGSSIGILEVSDGGDNSSGIYLRKTEADGLCMGYRVDGRDFKAGIPDVSDFSGEWRHAAGVYNSDSVYLYIDGVLSAEAYRGSAGDIVQGGIDRVVAGSDLMGEGEGFFSGGIDEVRIHGVQRSSSWIRLCYENQKQDQSLVSFTEVEEGVSAPSDFSGYASGNDIRLEWQDNSDNETGFEISYGSSPEAMQLLADVDANTEAYIHSTGGCDVSYYYSIKAYNSESESNNVGLGRKAYSSPCVPEYLYASGISNTEIEVTWTGDSYGYILYARDTSSGTWQEIYRGSEDYYLHSGLSCSSYMEYRVQAFTPDSVFSDFTGSVSAETDYCPLSPPSEVGIDTSSPERITVTWINGSDNAEGFNVYRREGESGEFIAVGHEIPSDSSLYIDRGLLCNQEYYYYVTSFNSFTESPPSDTVSGTTLFCGAGRRTSEMISIPGMYLDSLGNPVTGEYNAELKIYDNPEGAGLPVYEEVFYDIVIKNGYFVLNAGLTGDVASAVRGDTSLYIDVAVDGRDLYDQGPRPLTASPYSIKNSYNLHGEELPDSEGVSAPVGAFYVYTNGMNSRLYIKVGTSDTDWIEVRD